MPSCCGELVRSETLKVVPVSAAGRAEGPGQPGRSHLLCDFRPFLSHVPSKMTVTRPARPVRSSSFRPNDAVETWSCPFSDLIVWNNTLWFTARVETNRVALFQSDGTVTVKDGFFGYPNLAAGQLQIAGNTLGSLKQTYLVFAGAYLHLPIAIWHFNISKTFPKNRWICSGVMCYRSPAFNENLHEHISEELADDVGRESDTS